MDGAGAEAFAERGGFEELEVLSFALYLQCLQANMKNPRKIKSKEPPIKIGLIIGAGTGPRLAYIFKDFLFGLAQKQGINLEFLEDPLPGEKLYHSYQSLEIETGGDSNQFKEISERETIRLEKKVRDWYKDGFATIFRTAINAETLYLFRQNVKSH
jgi:hypothetical protein